jgi:hypothetical protein
MRYTSTVLALTMAALATPALAQSDPSSTYKKALDAAAANQITQPEAFWQSPGGEWSGISGHGADGGWYSVVVDSAGKVRAGRDEAKKFPVTLAAAAETALKNGIAKFEGVWLRDGKWFVAGADAAGKRAWLLIDGTSGNVEKSGTN